MSSLSSIPEYSRADILKGRPIEEPLVSKSQVEKLIRDLICDLEDTGFFNEFDKTLAIETVKFSFDLPSVPEKNKWEQESIVSPKWKP
ncbi:MAG: hypothetical protein V3R86_01370 [Candidatus Hydrothermarchaeaceae archaeon]